MNGTLRLGHMETAEDLLVKAIRIIADEDDGMNDERRQHIAMACQSYTNIHPSGMDEVKKVVTDEYIKNVLIPEICDNIAQQYIHNLVMSHTIGIWEYNHPQHELPDNIRTLIQTLNADESQTSVESRQRASTIRRQWSEHTGEYAGQHKDIVAPTDRIFQRRTREGVRHRAIEYAKQAIEEQHAFEEAHHGGTQ